MTYTNVEQLLHAVNASPADVAARLAYADALEEEGDAPQAAWQRRYAQFYAKVGPEQRDRIERDLDAANGLRRVRTLDFNDVVVCAARAMASVNGWHAVGGGTVANAYKWISVQTACVVVVHTDGSLYVGIGVARGNKGASLTKGLTGLASNARPEKFRAYADLTAAAVPAH